MKVVVTGAAGMIGSNLVRGLNQLGIDDVLAVDDLTNGHKIRNMRDLLITDYVDYREFYEPFARGAFGRVDVAFHQGACSDTMEHNGRFMMDTNYRCSRALLEACLEHGTRLLYASSASVYGASTVFAPEPAHERPLNVYAYSKLLFDQVVRRRLQTAGMQLAGFRYFNVYGPREQHKARMASVAFHHFNELRQTGAVKLFGEYGGYGPGGQQRDFVFVQDVVAVNLWFLRNPQARGIFNVGSGKAQPFNDVAHAMVNSSRRAQGGQPLSLEEMVSAGFIKYVPFPVELQGKYQCYTQADLTSLRAAGCDVEFADVQSGVGRYADWLLEGGAD